MSETDPHCPSETHWFELASTRIEPDAGDSLHLAVCETCRAGYADARELVLLLAAPPPESPGATPAASRTKRILAWVRVVDWRPRPLDSFAHAFVGMLLACGLLLLLDSWSEGDGGAAARRGPQVNSAAALPVGGAGSAQSGASEAARQAAQAREAERAAVVRSEALRKLLVHARPSGAFLPVEPLGEAAYCADGRAAEVLAQYLLTTRPRAADRALRSDAREALLRVSLRLRRFAQTNLASAACRHAVQRSEALWRMALLEGEIADQQSAQRVAAEGLALWERSLEPNARGILNGTEVFQAIGQLGALLQKP